MRVGIARSDPRGVLAVPVTTLSRDARRNSDIVQFLGLLEEYEAVGVVVGLPRTLANREGPAVTAARAWAAQLQRRAPGLEIHFADERMTTIVAQRNLSTSGVRGRSSRAVIDQAAAVEILQSYLDRTNAESRQTGASGAGDPPASSPE